MHDVLAQTTAECSLGTIGGSSAASSPARKYRTPNRFWILQIYQVIPTAAAVCYSSWLGNIAVIINFFVVVPTSYARIFPPPEPGGSGSQWTWISEADTARARTLYGASDGSTHDNNRPLALARAMSPEGPCVCRTCREQRKCLRVFLSTVWLRYKQRLNSCIE